MAKIKLNGDTKWVVTMIAACLAFVAQYVTLQNTVTANTEDIQRFEKKKASVETVDNIKEDIREIKKDVKELLRR